MKIAGYNVNSINARLPVLLHLLSTSKPDVACLQQLKLTDENSRRRHSRGGDPPRAVGRGAISGRRRAVGGAKPDGSRPRRVPPGFFHGD
jgi:hypothetical protein